MGKAYLVLENGSTFCGESFGLAGEVTAEVVFSTTMIGYLETLSDKNYFGQIVVQTFPSIGNYGVIPDDFESECIGPKGYIVKEWCQIPSNFRSEGDLDTFFKEKSVVGLCGIDTRALTKIIREQGVMNGTIVTDLSHVNMEALKSFKITNAVKAVSTKNSYVAKAGGSTHLAVIDCGTKRSMPQELCRRDVQVTVCPYSITARELKKMGVFGVILSDGPGDPHENTEICKTIEELMELKLPILGIGLGHQILALANGIEVYKLKYGHHGANQSVKYLETGRAYITNQNHNYAVAADTVKPDVAQETFVNINDKTCEGIAYQSIPAFSVQFQPESGGETMDTSWLYDKFIELVKTKEVK